MSAGEASPPILEDVMVGFSADLERNQTMGLCSISLFDE